MGLTGVKVILPPVRFSYLHAVEAHLDKKGKENYGSMLIVGKDDEKTVKIIEKGIRGAYEEGKGLLGMKAEADSISAVCTKRLKTTWYDGDADRPEDPACENAMFLNTSSNRKVELFHGNPPMPLTNPDKIYSGMYGRASVTFKAYVTDDGGKGIACYLNGIQKTKDGARLDGMGSSRSSFDDGFDDLDVDDDYNNDFADAPVKKKAPVKEEDDEMDI